MSEVEHYLSPASVEEAVCAMADAEVTVVCGGTDLAPQTESGVRRYTSTLMNIRRVAGMSGITTSGEQIRIGALTTVAEIQENEIIRASVPVLVEAADHFASDQIRNAASIGGNICNASPAGDMIIPLMVLGAEVELASWKDGSMQTRNVPLDAFFLAPGKTVKQPEELLTAVVFNKPRNGFVARFRKSGPRPALEISTVSLGIGGDLENGVLRNVRAAMGAVAPKPLRASGLEAALDGKPLDAAHIEAAAAAACEDATPIDDVRGSVWYRKHLVRVFTEEVLNDVREKGN